MNIFSEATGTSLPKKRDAGSKQVGAKEKLATPAQKQEELAISSQTEATAAVPAQPEDELTAPAQPEEAATALAQAQEELTVPTQPEVELAAPAQPGEAAAVLAQAEEGLGISSQLAIPLKKTIMGGYSAKSVEDYVAAIEADAQQVKQQLEKQIEGLLAEKRTVSQECAVLRDQIKETEASLRRASEQASSMLPEDQMAAVKERISSLETKLEQANGELAKQAELRQERDSLEAVCAERAATIDQLEKDVTNSRLEHEHSIRQNKLLEAALKESRDASTEELQKLFKDNQALKEDCENLQKQIESRGAILQNADDEQKKIEELRMQLEQERQLLQEQKDQIASQKEDIDLAIQTIDDKATALERRDEAVRAAETSLAERETSVRAAEASLTEREASVQAQMLEIEQEKAEMESIAAQMEENRRKEETISVLQKQHAQEVEKIRVLENDVEDKAQIIEQLRSDVARLAYAESQRAQAQQNVKSLSDALSQVMGFMEQQSEDMDLILDRVKRDQACMKEILDEQAALKMENAALVEARHADQNRIAAFEAENERLARELQTETNPSLQRNEDTGEMPSTDTVSGDAADNDIPGPSNEPANQQEPTAIAKAKHVFEKVKEEISGRDSQD